MINKEITDERSAALKQYKKEYYVKNKEKFLKRAEASYSKNKDILRVKNQQKYSSNKAKAHYVDNREEILIYGKEYRERNKEMLKLKKKKFYNDNKETETKRIYAYFSKRLKEDNFFRLKNSIRTLLRMSFTSSGIKKNTKTTTILGCTFAEFKKHIESKFEPWMTWNNKGNPKDGIIEPNKTWDIDHIIPISTAKTEEDVIRLNHYTNLQPLCTYQNRFIKRNKISE